MPADDADDPQPPRSPLPPDDRLWRHPTEVDWPRPRHRAGRRSSTTRVWPIAVVSGLAGAVLALGVVAVVTGLDPRVVERVTQRVAMPDVLVDPITSRASTNLAVVVERIMPSVLRLDVSSPTGPRIGSAVVVRDDGHLVTNAHVVSDADAITVVNSDGLGVPAHVVSLDAAADVALIAVDDGYRDEAPWVPAVLGTSDDLRVGQVAVAIGSPLGLVGAPSVSVGVVSGLGRRVQSTDGLTLADLVQTDAAIAQGSSGGALVDGSGAVIGITTAVAVGEDAADGLGFAVPIDTVRAVIDAVLGGSEDARGAWLGIQGHDGAGVAVIAAVAPGSPAEESGLAPGDVLTAIDGEPTPTMASVVDYLEHKEPGDTVRCDVEREGERMQVDVTLAER